MYYFELRGDDPRRTSYSEENHSIEEMRSNFVGTFIQVGEEPHDVEQVIGILTQEQAERYFDED